ncbi:NADH dehydrogenase [ubiquinone] 1 alpha subcomplex assembly factor 3 [Selaginella moellendorffii]|uniref:NADH dehydrogenase [ubiquinone] 1 alpha subcomplex assembly factor 3 n=1 Tax=Selaginella moellendorffii TaxID=88036 RepID=UPI000D1C3875|nr:NADH dehydrogenase [ubiquinone] 1 alpha subcomplex assembly factor 3 [Selaginella moellendorffii]|eukprot:XP_002971224.2 NADH dehydrogenase [ubiquinone] 1 alpha subcomplex assembly factor 3 [Selaginella moellendorffii]
MAMALARARVAHFARGAAGIAQHRRGNTTSIHDFDLFGKMKESSGRVAVDALSEESFSVDQVEYFDSIICLSKFVLSWTPKTFEEITPESLAIVDLLTPTPEILVLGTGNTTKFPSKEVKEFLKSRNIKIESVDSRHAAIAFNFMNVECRDVVAAMLPCGKEPERTHPF